MGLFVGEGLPKATVRPSFLKCWTDGDSACEFVLCHVGASAIAVLVVE